jgi:hypothetical protein
MNRQVARPWTCFLSEGGLIAPVEGLQRLHEREAREVRPHRDGLLRLGTHLLGEHRFEEVAVGRFRGGGILEQGFEPLPALEEPEVLTVLLQAFQLGRGRHATTPACAQAS